MRKLRPKGKKKKNPTRMKRNRLLPWLDWNSKWAAEELDGSH